MPLVVTGLSHRTAPVDVRERFAMTEAGIPGVLQKLREVGAIAEGVILSTCNRVEIYAVSAQPGEACCAALRSCLLEAAGGQAIPEGALYSWGEPRSVEHLFRVACGLDSMVLGETEILGQLKKAYELARQGGHTGARLNKAFQKAFNVAKQIRTETGIQRGSISVSSVSVELAEHIFSSLSARRVMVLGAGDTSEKAARALVSRGVKQVVVSNRSRERAVALAEALGGCAIGFDEWEREFASIDIVISSTSASHYLLDPARLEPLMTLRQNRPLLLIDIAVPRDIDPAVNILENVYLYNIDDLQAIAEDCLKQRQEEVDRCQAIIREKARGLLEAPGGPPAPASRPALGSS